MPICGYGEAYALEIAFPWHSGYVAGIGRGGVDRLSVAMADLVVIRFHYSDNAREGSWQRGFAIYLQSGDDHRSGCAGSVDGVGKGTAVLRVERSQAQIDDMDLVLEAPVDRPDDRRRLVASLPSKIFTATKSASGFK